jgi:plastocyanin
MVDKCPNCGETLITRTIQKKIGLGSIDFPVAQICQKCNWNRDLTGAGDIVAKPPSPDEIVAKREKKPEIVRQAPEKPKYVPEKKAPDMNKIITIVLALLVIAGIIWAFIPKGTEQPGAIQPSPAATPTITSTAAATATAISEVTPTGNKEKVRITRYKYSNPNQQNLKIKPGDEVTWVNDDSYSLTLVSKEGLFEDKLLDNGKQTPPYLFKKTGTYTFDIMVSGVKKFNGTVVVEP